MISRILLTLALLAVAGFVLLVLIGLWDPYEQNTGALGRAVVEAEHTRTAGVGEMAAVEE
jgi:uncharacterized membrane protein YqjE